MGRVPIPSPPIRYRKSTGGRFNDAEIAKVLKEYEEGAKVQELCRRYGISVTTLYKWRAKLADERRKTTGARMSEVALEDENLRLKMLLGEAVLENAVLKEMLSKSGK